MCSNVFRVCSGSEFGKMYVCRAAYMSWGHNVIVSPELRCSATGGRELFTELNLLGVAHSRLGKQAWKVAGSLKGIVCKVYRNTFILFLRSRGQRESKSIKKRIWYVMTSPPPSPPKKGVFWSKYWVNHFGT